MAGLPTNSGKAKDYGCKPVSSNCVVWQGQDLECIGVCRGDTISDVVAKMAAELCMLLDMFNLEDFDLSCLAIPSEETPENFNELIQILIDRICALEGIDPGEVEAAGGCPDDCLVNIAGCFQYQTQQGDTVVQMTLVDYVRAIGELVCQHAQEIMLLQGGLQSVGEEQNLQAARISTVEEEKVDEAALQYNVNPKTNPQAGLKFLPDATREIENSLIKTQDALGSPSEIYTNMLKAGNIGSEEKLDGAGNLDCLTGWTNSPEKLAEAHGNLWLAVRDIRNAVDYIQSNFISKSCSDINYILRATVNTGGSGSFVTVFADGSTGFTTDWRECEANTQFLIEDAKGNSTTFRTSALALITNPSGYQVDITNTSVDTTLDITVTAQTCFTNEIACITCEKDVSYVVAAPTVCPAVTLTLTSSSVQYEFASTPGYTYTVNVYYPGGMTPVVTQIIGTPAVIVNNIIMGLLEGTDYEIEVTVIDGAGEETQCARIPFTTLENNCTPPTGVTAILTI